MSRWQSWKCGVFGTVLGTVLFGVLAAQPALAVPVVSITGPAGNVTVGSALTLTVKFTDALDLSAFQFDLAFNPAVLRATSVVEGPFLGTGGNTFFGAGSINNTTGTITSIFDSLIGAVPGVNGTGNLVTLNFNVIGAGVSSLVFSNALFLNSLFNDLSPQVQNGSVTAVAVIPEPSSAALLLAGLAGFAAWRRLRSPGA
jgi:hypothetical protein